MQISVKKNDTLSVTTHLPASKSISNRALIINALSGAGVVPQNVSDCDDTFVMVRALETQGKSQSQSSPLSIESSQLSVESSQLPVESSPLSVESSQLPVVDIMAAGTAMRFLTAYLSVTEGERIITGTERMRHRPISILVDALRSLGADISYEGEEGFPPLRIRGKRLEGGCISLPGNVSSQYISAMLMIGPVLQQGLTLTLTDGIASRPYIDMTLSIMREFGAQAEWVSEQQIHVAPQPYTAKPYYIENDWSASSYWFELVALTPGSEVHLPGLFVQSLQGDQVVREIFEKLGVEATSGQCKAAACHDTTVSIHDTAVSCHDTAVSCHDTVASNHDAAVSNQDTVVSMTEGFVLRHTGRKVERLDIDMLHCPDLAQTVVVTCCMLNVPFRITGLQSLKIKETDRIAALRAELQKLGYLVSEADDSILFWDGERCDQAMQTGADGTQHLAGIDTYEDHRMAMSFAPCCQVLGEVFINNPQVVSKSYPKFWDDMRHAQFIIHN